MDNDGWTVGEDRLKEKEKSLLKMLLHLKDRVHHIITQSSMDESTVPLIDEIHEEIDDIIIEHCRSQITITKKT